MADKDGLSKKVVFFKMKYAIIMADEFSSAVFMTLRFQWRIEENTTHMHGKKLRQKRWLFCG